MRVVRALLWMCPVVAVLAACGGSVQGEAQTDDALSSRYRTLFGQAKPSTPSRTDDGNSVELGVKFRSSVAGQVVGLRFFKGAGNTGLHTGHLWSATGTLLASVTFSQERARGWQSALFSVPVSVEPGTVYVASYLAPQGHFAADSSYFSAGGHASGPLYALEDGESGGNGVYVYTSVPAFPSATHDGRNYYVDVLFLKRTSGSDGGAVTPPTDAGVPTVDAGVPTVDAGVPTVDAGTPSGGDGGSAPVSLRILPLGDSLTQGGVNANRSGLDPSTLDGYRGDLWNLLTGAGYQLDYVGSEQLGDAQLADPDEDGFSGACIKVLPCGGGTLYPQTAAWLNAYQPDLVIMQGGENDFSDASLTEAADAANMESWIQLVWATRPAAKIIVSGAPWHDNYDQLVHTYVTGLQAEGKPIRWVPYGEDIERIDGTHPSAAGYATWSAELAPMVEQLFPR